MIENIQKTIDAIDRVIKANTLSPIQIEQLQKKKEILLKKKDVLK